MEWLIAVVRVPSEPSRHRVAVWRELRRAGALPLGAGTWAFPNRALALDVIDKVRELIARTPEGDLVVLDARPRDDTSAALLVERYTAEREAEWFEFIADCAKFEAEIEREIAEEKFTLAELEEEEQSLDRLRRWYQEVSSRDVFGAPSAAKAQALLGESSQRLEDFAEQVYRAIGQ